jgi:hypothetical protein
MPRRAALLPLVLFGGLLTACSPEPEGPPDDTAPPDTGPDCGEGELADGDSCVPEACGTGTWGALALGEATLYVDAAAAEGGDGSLEAPFTSVQAAVDAAGPDTTVAVAAGSYRENVEVDHGQAGIHIAGRCRELVTLDASAGTSDDPGFRFEMSAASATLSGFTVRDSSYAGLIVTSGGLTLREVDLLANAYSGLGAVTVNRLNPVSLLMEDCVVAENISAGIGLFYQGTQVTLRRCSVRDQVRGVGGQSGTGISITAGADLLIEDSELLRNRNQAILMEEAGEVVLRDSLVQDTLPDPDGLFGQAAQAIGGTLEIDGCELVGNAHSVVQGSGEDTHITIRDTEFRDTRLTGYGSFGAGVQVGEGASLVMERCQLEGTATYGVMGRDPGTTVDLSEVSISDHREDQLGTVGGAVWMISGSTLSMDGCSIDGSTTTGIYVAETGTTATIRDTTVAGVHPNREALYGTALSVGWGAQADVSGCSFSDTIGLAVLASDEGTTLGFRDSEILGTRRGEYYTVAMGLATQIGAVVEASGLRIEGTEGPALLGAYAPTVLSCIDCELRDNQFAGVTVLGGASVTLEGASISATGGASNLGGGVGIYTDPWGWDAPSLVLRDSEVVDNPIAGIWLQGQGSYLIAGNSIHGGEGETRGTLQRCGDAVYATDGVTAYDGELGLALSSNTIEDGRGAGLFLHGASASLEGNTWRDNLVDLVVQGEACERAPAGLDSEPLGSVERCPTWDYSTCSDSFDLLLALASPEARMPPPR